jgi:hypothetical protein
MDCTSVAPCNSITKAVTAALGSRKWILVKADATSYMDSVDLSGTRAKEVVIKGAGATVDATPDDVPAFNLGTLVAVAANVRIEGLTITGGFDSTDADGIFCGGTGAAKPVLTLVKAVVRNNSGSGIDATNCNVTSTGSTFNGNAAGGISLSTSNFTLTNNLLFDNGAGGSPFGALRLIDVPSTVGAPRTVRFNTVGFNNATGTTPAGLVCTSPLGAVDLNSNIFWGTNATRSEVTQGEANCTHQHSLIGANPLGTVGTNVDITGVPADGATIFVSPVGPFNLHLKVGSPAINRGDPVATEPVDIDGEARPKGTLRDIGADEAE